MSNYFEVEDSIKYRLGSDIEETVELIANRYIAQNPAELSWSTNDTHGTGIVLLAGVEIQRLRS